MSEGYNIFFFKISLDFLVSLYFFGRCC